MYRFLVLFSLLSFYRERRFLHRSLVHGQSVGRFERVERWTLQICELVARHTIDDLFFGLRTIVVFLCTRDKSSVFTT